MDCYKCHKCLLYTCIVVEEGFYCIECDTLFSILNKKSNKSKTFNNKKIHFNNVMKEISKNYNIDDDVESIQEIIKKDNIKSIYINQSFVSNHLKTKTNRFKDYKKVFNILNELDSNKKKISPSIKNDIEILFLSYIKFLSNKNRLDSISYNLVLGNIFKLFDINKSFKPTVKDEKEDLWNIFIYNITNNYFYGDLDKINDEVKYENYRPKIITKSLYKYSDYYIS